MHLLDAKIGQFRFVHDPRSVHYATISHTWSQEGKQTYQDILEIQNTVNCLAHHPLPDCHERVFNARAMHR